MKKICHVTSAHPPEDGRIFRRECVSAAMSWLYFLIVLIIIGFVALLARAFVFYQRRDT